MKKTIICTVCPNGCAIEAEYTSREDLKLTGYTCKRGITYATDECFAPKRTFTSSMRITGASRRMMPVRTDAPVPKELLMDCATAAREMTLEAPMKSRQVLQENFLGSGANLVAAMTLEREA